MLWFISGKKFYEKSPYYIKSGKKLAKLLDEQISYLQVHCYGKHIQAGDYIVLQTI